MSEMKDKLRADLEALSAKCKRLEASGKATEADECEVLAQLNDCMRRFLDERDPTDGETK